MGIINKIIGPISKYDDSIPYTYIAKVKILERDDNLVNHYFSDTICGLVEYLSSNNIPEKYMNNPLCSLAITFWNLN